MLVAAPAIAQFSDGYNFIEAVKSRDGQKATDLIKKPGAPINARDGQTGDSALHIVTKRHDKQWLDFLLAAGASPNIKDRFGNTPLHLASQSGDIEAMTQLIHYGATVNAVNNNGETPLILAVHARDAGAVRLLVNNDGDPHQRDTIAGKNAIDYVQEDPRAASLTRILAEAKPKAPAKKVAGPVLH